MLGNILGRFGIGAPSRRWSMNPLRSRGSAGRRFPMGALLLPLAYLGWKNRDRIQSFVKERFDGMREGAGTVKRPEMRTRHGVGSGHSID